MGYLDNTVEYGFGQLGSAYLRDADADFYPPSGLVVVAITVIETCEFNELVADTSGYTKADGSEGVAYFGTGTEVLMNGTNAAGDTVASDAIDAADDFPTGITIYGRWTRVQIDQGKVILYFGR
tara:strand:+ start:144 stop:515 length:372 start_codon:yes stop_codon:yes gene_type:complete